MKKRWIGFAAWAVLAGLLYFFENNAGTRILLFCSLLLPFVPAIRQSLFGPDSLHKAPQVLNQTRETFREREKGEEADPGDVRIYQPGDPVNRIHWKLSAKRDELLVRERRQDRRAEKTEKEIASRNEATVIHPRPSSLILTGSLLIALALVLLWTIPPIRQGMQMLLNRLFEASEKRNAYAYDRFPVLPGASPGWAMALLGMIMLTLTGMTVISRSRLAALGLMTGSVLFQIYFGLPFPAWVNVMLFTLFALWMMKRPRTRKDLLSMVAGIAALSLVIPVIWPGVDSATEAASETVRDHLSEMAQNLTGTGRELPEGENETRHVHTQSLASGDRESRTDREFRLVTVEEEQIAMPHWVDYLRIILLLLLTVALVVLPFVPFVLLNQRRKKALENRALFQSENNREAICAIFQHLIAWLEATGNGEGNLPYAEWHADVFDGCSERFTQCEKLFEEAAYSTHEMKDEQRRQVLELLEETEQTLQQKADWKQRLRLKYKECLWI